MQHTEGELGILGDKDLAKIIAGVHEAFKKRHPDLKDIPFPANGTANIVKSPETPVVSKIEAIKIYPKISLEEEWRRQANGFVNLGFHSELGLTKEKYLESLPKFTPQPESFKGRLDTPVLVETRISPKLQSELVGIQHFLYGLSITDWNKSLKNYTTPEVPYAAWLEDGRNNLNKKPKDVRSSLKADEVGGTELDGIALYISNPKILEHHWLDLSGTSVESDRAAVLRLWDGWPELNVRFVDRADPKFGSVVRGRQK